MESLDVSKAGKLVTTDEEKKKKIRDENRAAKLKERESTHRLNNSVQNEKSIFDAPGKENDQVQNELQENDETVGTNGENTDGIRKELEKKSDDSIGLYKAGKLYLS